VNLSADNDLQWQRLLKALDPHQPPAINPIQNLALAVTEPSASLVAPGWHPQGSVWLALGLLGVILLAGLIFLLLSDWPVLGGTVSAMVGAFAFILGLMGLREDKDFFQRLSHFLGKSHPAQAMIAAALVAGIILWGVVGRPKVVRVVCGDLGCKPPGVLRLGIGEFKNLTPNATKLGLIWTEGTGDVLRQKLSEVPSLQVINVASPQVLEETKRDLDYWIDGQFRLVDQAELISRLSARGGRYLSPDVRVTGKPADSLENISALQNKLTLALLPRLGVMVDPALAEALANTPTGNLGALELNNEGVDLIKLGDYPAAEAKFRAALSLDPNYGAAYSNLGFTLANQGEYDAAVVAYQAAIERLPGYAPFHYNLGNLYAQMGNTDRALASLQEAIGLDPGYVQAYNELGNVYIELEQWPDARRKLERGLELDATFAPLHKNLGRVALAQGKPDEAIASLQTALQLYEGKPLEAIYWLAEAHAAAGDETAACQQLAAYWALDPNRIQQWAPAAADLAARLGCP
jgi:tetratricopeptide (TPR) repeat protein